MGSTDDLIESLSGGLVAVRRLWPPALRALAWIAFATLVVIAFVLLRGTRSDLADELHQPAYWVQIAAAWLTGTSATLACFEASLPDRSRLWRLLPVPAVALWLFGFGFGCLADWVGIPAGAPVTAASISCLETLIGTSIPLGLAIWLMLRRTRPLYGASAAWLAGIAVAGFADTAHLIINVVDPSALILLINIVPSAVIATLIALLGRKTAPVGS